MSGIPQNVVYASLVIAALMGLASIADLATGSPFGGQTVFDILFIISAGITAFLGIDCLRDAK
ncbi:MAG: hypothetical protein GY758_28920 [Fuerstiella sp.]|jgi:hypothetical protein|nr:hypothetical protein [Fuerstiella sp.]MCP4506578.1 hypothetical protein [Fuerstiella sp.]MDG2129109.1 hypothetical protein [Fuerstiella sp.]